MRSHHGGVTLNLSSETLVEVLQLGGVEQFGQLQITVEAVVATRCDDDAVLLADPLLVTAVRVVVAVGPHHPTGESRVLASTLPVIEQNTYVHVRHW